MICLSPKNEWKVRGCDMVIHLWRMLEIRKVWHGDPPSKNIGNYEGVTWRSTFGEYWKLRRSDMAIHLRKTLKITKMWHDDPSLKDIENYEVVTWQPISGRCFGRQAWDFRSCTQKKLKLWTKLNSCLTLYFIPTINEINNANKKWEMNGRICTGIPRGGQPKKSQEADD